MSETASGHDHHHAGFIRTYVFSTDHKMIAKQFLFLGMSMLLLGGFLAMIVRYQLAYPVANKPTTISEAIPSTLSSMGIVGVTAERKSREGETLESIATSAYGDKEKVSLLLGANSGMTATQALPVGTTVKVPSNGKGTVGAERYNMAFTMHATIMIFFAIMPILIGCFGNYLIPLQIGAGDMAFPILNLLSFWISAVAGVLILTGFFVPGGHAAGGWTSYPPLSAVPSYTGVDWGQNLWCIALIVLGISSLMGSINYITTVINMRAPGMTWFRLPLTVWALWITAILLLLALPVLTAAVAMLLFDRTMGTSFFLPKGGGYPILWQHLFWFFGHPEVYIMILPAMGIASEILPVFARKPVFGYRAMVYAICAIAFLSWIVWGHHMFQSGMSPVMGMAFMFSTVVIGVPSAIKTFNWLGTLWGGTIRFTTPMLHALAFVLMFVIGGLSGIFMATTPVDMYIHDTYFIVAHIHYVLFGGSLFGVFAGVTYWFPKMFGRMMNETLGRIHWLLTLIGFNLVFFPMHIIGIGGHMRRIANPLQYNFLQPLQWWNEFMSISAFALFFGAQLPFIINFFYSLFAGKKAEQNPWQANTLEWADAPTPPPHGNFLEVPHVYRGPYEYSAPEVKEDWLPQTRKLGPEAVAQHG